MTRNWNYRFGVFSRAVAAIVGGYYFASIIAVCVAKMLPLPLATAAMAAMLLTFLLYAAAVVWVFAARTALLAWFGLAAPLLVCGIHMLLSGGAMQ